MDEKTPTTVKAPVPINWQGLSGPSASRPKRALGNERSGSDGCTLPRIAQPAPPEILDRFKEGFECWNRAELDLMQDMYAADAVFDVSAVFTDVVPMRGHENIRRYWNEMQETWEGIRQDPLEAYDLGDRRYVVDLRLWGKGQQSGIEVDQRFAMLYTLREDGKVKNAQLFPDVATAISAAESSASQPA